MTEETKRDRDKFGHFIKGHKLSAESLEKMKSKLKGRKVWNTGLHVRLNPKGEFKKGHTPAHKGKQLESLWGEKHFAWKGDKATYWAKHIWASRHKVRPKFCSKCGKEGNNHQIHWANIDHTYKRNLDDYIALCSSCHKIYDLKNRINKH